MAFTASRNIDFNYYVCLESKCIDNFSKYGFGFKWKSRKLAVQVR